MATYESLTQAQKDDIAALDKFLRSLFTALEGVNKQATPDVWNSFASTNVDPVTATIDAGEVIPNSTNYAGAKDLTIEEFKALQALSVQLQVLRGTNIGLIVKAVGVNR